MKHHIDPKIDCVFKALLGSEENKNLLIHFLNAILKEEFEQPIISAEILNPYNDKEFINDKLSIVDVKVKDNLDHIYQIEIQLKSFSYLPSRMIYNWANIYSKQIKEGYNYDLLRPTYSIWLLAEDLIKNDNDYAHNYKLRDKKGRLLNQHGGIWLLELHKFNQQQIENDEQLWLKFFKDGEKLDNQSLPDWMQTDEMRQAMNTLSVFSEKEKQYDRYQARQEYLRIQHTIQFELERERKDKQQALLCVESEKQRADAAIKEKESEKQRADAAESEIARLKVLLKQQ